MKYRVKVCADAYAEVVVEAESEEQAIEKAFHSDYHWDYDNYRLEAEPEGGQHEIPPG